MEHSELLNLVVSWVISLLLSFVNRAGGFFCSNTCCVELKDPPEKSFFFFPILVRAVIRHSPRTVAFLPFLNMKRNWHGSRLPAKLIPS